MATKAKAKRTAKAGEGSAKSKTAKIDTADPREATSATVGACGDGDDEFERVMVAYRDACDALKSFAVIVRDGSPGDIRRATNGDPILSRCLRYDVNIEDFVAVTYLYDVCYSSGGTSKRLALAKKEFDLAWGSMFEAIFDRFPERVVTFDELRRSFNDCLSFWLNHLRRYVGAKDVNHVRKLDNEWAEAGAYEQLRRLKNELMAAEGAQIAADRHNAKGRPATGPRKQTTKKEPELLQRLYILSKAILEDGGIDVEAANIILNKKTLDDWEGTPVCMFDDDGKPLGKPPITKGKFEKAQKNALWQWIYRPASGTEVPETLVTMAQRFAKNGRAMSWPKAFCDAVGIQVDD